ncbi:hypothetical protein GF327_09545 [Candidatus Woesearchaeota archaeon]|nr:hypothetical protein [Candidatus Woesearchaeota archaeon]
MKKIFLFLMLIIMIFILGCGPKCPECPAIGSYSECNDKAVKTRTNYKCSEATNFECESYIEEIQCSTKIKLTGNMDAIISPTIEEKVKGIIKLEIRNFPVDTKIVGYYLSGGNLPPIEERGPLMATNQGNTWVGMIDTNEYGNGLYQVGVVAFTKEEFEGDPQGYAQGQILIIN